METSLFLTGTNSVPHLTISTTDGSSCHSRRRAYLRTIVSSLKIVPLHLVVEEKMGVATSKGHIVAEEEEEEGSYGGIGGGKVNNNRRRRRRRKTSRKSAGGGGSEISGSRRGDGDCSNLGAHYRKLLRADPENPLLLRNYGKYLHEVERDYMGAEYCYGRAVAAAPRDGELLSLYGKLVWEVHGDEVAAEEYFRRAVEASPSNCQVAGSYAYFLWDVDEKKQGEDLRYRAAEISPATEKHSHSRQHY